MKRRLLVSYDQAVMVTKQHKKPCSDCPWRRDSVAGWLADMSPEEWVQHAQGDGIIECHTRKSDEFVVQCAGAAAFRANICKSTRPMTFVLRGLSVQALRAPPDRARVFAHSQEFITHHAQGKKAEPA